MQESLGKTEVEPLRSVSARAAGAARDQREQEPRRGPVALVASYLDVVLVVVATAPALLLGAPLFGYLVGAIAWVLQRVLAHTDRRWIRNATEPRTQLGLNLFEAFGRIWLLAGAIVIAGLVGDRADGLTAALVIFGAYSVAFAIRVINGPPARPQAADPPARPQAAGSPQQRGGTLPGSVADASRGGASQGGAAS